ncbi:MAG: GDP-mannose 4,6-dehydratase [Candidatus Krumholzibacteria bacterium]|nr:GDP-mannose 4,6-dehydratase [Candidatus Krumholzibacteria bacterium]
MRALITGACGFVGRYLVHELVSSGYEVLATDIIEPSPVVGSTGKGEEFGIDTVDGGLVAWPPAFPEGVVFRRCDLLDFPAVRKLVTDWNPRFLFHLAAQSSAARSFDDPKATLETNLFGTLSILEALKEETESAGKGTKVLSVGSSEEYGIRSRQEMPLVEESPIEPVSPYAVSKTAQSLLSLQYHRTYGLDTIATRSFSHTGPGQADHFVLPSFAKQCAEIKGGFTEPLLNVGNLDVVRDFLDVRDVVRAYRLVIEKGKSGEVYNVCSGNGLELRGALDTLIRKVPAKINVVKDPGLFRPADVPVMIGDSGKLRLDTGWEPRIRPEKMLSDLIVYWEHETARLFEGGSRL